MGALKELLEGMELLLKEGKHLLAWEASMKGFCDELAGLSNSGIVTIVLTNTEDIDYSRSFEVPIHLVRHELTELGLHARERLEESIRSFKMAK